jgi:probable phosphoglycerate mutase
MTTFFLIRHGNTTVGEKITGRTPGVHLSEHGRRQAEELAGRMSDVPLTAIFSSPLDRTRQTAQPLARDHKLDVVIEPGLVEIDFGEWTGRSFAELEAVAQWKLFHVFRNGTRIPGGELMVEVQSRMAGVIEKLRQQYPDGRIALVSHGDPIRAALAYYLGISLDQMLRLSIDTASVSVVQVDDWGAEVRCVNHTGALPRC